MPETSQWQHVRLIAGRAPGTWTVATAFLGNPVGDAVLRCLVLHEGDPATTYDLSEPDASRMAERVECYLERTEGRLRK